MFSFNWFRSKKESPVVTPAPEPLVKQEHPYALVKLVNDVITVILKDGSILSKSNASEQEFMDVRNAYTEDQVISILTNQETLVEKMKEDYAIEKVQSVKKGFGLLNSLTDDFEVVNDNIVYLKGISRSLPPLLVEKFCEILSHYENEPFNAVQDDEEYIAHKRFFLWCCLNPRAEVVDKLYGFLFKNGMKITKQGFFVGLRNVVATSATDKALVDAISNAYNKVKAVWKKNPEKFRVVENDGEYSIEKVTDMICKGVVIGNLASLYNDLPNMEGNRYTDNYTKTFDIRIGKVVSMRPEDCSWSTADCAEKGLHFAGHTAPYVLCGNTTVFTLHNPMKVVGIGAEKGRCYEYLPFMTTTVSEADEIMNSQDFDFLQLDEEYAVNELNDLSERVKEGFAVEAKKYEFNLPKISSVEIDNIVSSLESMKDVISNRITLV
jgi:hypothetical protein